MSQSFMLLILISLMGTFNCSEGFLFRWELRLSGGSSDFDGRLEIRYGDQWGYICADGFGKIEGDVVCRIMENNEAIPNKLQALEVYPVLHRDVHQASEIWPFILEGVKCNGSEDRIFECQHNGLFNASCTSSTVVVVKCGRPYAQGFNSAVVPKRYVGVYFCDIARWHWTKFLYCDGGTQIDATRRFLSENSVRYTISNRYCGTSWKDLRFSQCNPHGECNSNDSVICINKWNYYNLPSTAARGPRLLRLVEGNTSQEGRLEVSLGNGVWGSVCSRFWGPGSATLVCRRLGFAGIKDHGTVRGNASYPILQYLSCNDEHENYWYDCLSRYTWPEEDACSSYAFVKCSEFANEGALRLMGTPVSFEGRLQIFYQGVWGAVRHRHFLTVVCNQLGYPGGNYSSAFINFDLYPLAPIILDITACNGSEVSVLECEHQWYNESYPDKFVGGVDVRCNRPAEFTPRLYNGTSVYEGRLEVWASNQWRRVCSSTIGTDEAEVICRHLGHQSLETFYNWSKFGNGISPVLSWSFSCNPLATSLEKCYRTYLSLRKLDCESVAVRCTKRKKDWKKLEENAENYLFVKLGLAFSLLGLVTLSGLIIYMMKRKHIRRNEPAADLQGQEMSPQYTRVSTTSPVRNNLDPPPVEPPPSFESLL